MNLWATAVQAVVYSGVSITFGLLYKRALKRDRERLERIISGVEAVFGVTTEPLQLTFKEKFVELIAVYKKGIYAAAGVVLIELLAWLSQGGVLDAILDPIVPAQFRPAIGILAGGIALVVAVVRGKNKEQAAAVEAEQPAVAAYTPARVPALTSPTSVVQLQAAPDLSYL